MRFVGSWPAIFLFTAAEEIAPLINDEKRTTEILIRVK